MPLLWNAIKSVFFAVVSYGIDRIAKKYAPAIVALGVIVSAIVGAVTVYLNFMFEKIAQLNETIPEVVLNVWGWVMPGNAIPCLTILLTARAMSWFVKMGLNVINAKAKAVS
ncbi:minor coat protein [Methylomonas sp. DH-1]|uniref:minor coat protein n=1 Tax=Methylomonas sp. (strain DH-1) TaxID=1727196 RepID=UPI0007C89424|nr:minor coat protein [Methylomonas sp. DH-1]ANE55680.1 hypothetical protein AYM39_11160 [Methylomonas sp. DH-1]